jgi:thioredoxin-related protein
MIVMLVLFMTMIAASIVSADITADSLDAGLVNPGYAEKPGWFANSFLDIREDLGEAAGAGKRVMLYFYQDGCPYCQKLLDTNFSIKETEAKTRKHYDVVAINMWGDREVVNFNGAETTEKGFAKSLRVMFTPTLLFLNEQGDVTLRVNGYYPPHKFNAALDYAVSHNGSDPSFRDYFAALSPPAASGVLHHDAAWLPANSKLDARDGKPLLVLFEQKDCAPCDELHLDVLKRPQSRGQLQRLDVVLLDMWSKQPLQRADGKTSSAAQWARDLNVQYAPTLVFFDAQGKEVFRTEAYLKSFHVQSAMDYVVSGGYLEQPSFQRFIAARAEALEAQGVHVDLMN